MTSAVAGLVNNTEFTDVTVDSPLEQRSYPSVRIIRNNWQSVHSTPQCFGPYRTLNG